MASAESEQPRQKGLEFRNHPRSDELEDRFQHERNRFEREFQRYGSALRPPVELYFHAQAEVHVRFRNARRQGWNREPHDCCVRSKAAERDLGVGNPVAENVIPVLHQDVGRDGGRKSAVLVDIRQLAQLPESPGLRVIPSVVRLQPLDACSCATGEALDHVGGPPDSPLAPVSEPVIKDREFRSPVVGGGVLPRPGDIKDVGQVVEGGSHVMDALPDPDMPLLRYLADLFDANTDPPLTISIGPGAYEIRYGTFPNQLFKAVDVRFCPVELG